MKFTMDVKELKKLMNKGITAMWFRHSQDYISR